MDAHSIVPLNTLARRLRVPVGWLREEAIAGRIPCIRAGRQILVAPPAVEAALARRAAAPNESCRPEAAHG
jgi:hypothetical protein